MMCPITLVLDLCPENVMPTCWVGTWHNRTSFCAFWFIWEISVDGQAWALPPREVRIETGISASGSEVYIIWNCDRMVNTLLLWTVNVVFIPSSLLVLEEASFTRDHSCRFSFCLDTWMSESYCTYNWFDQYKFLKLKLQMGKEIHEPNALVVLMLPFL